MKDQETLPASPELIQRLVDGHRSFLAFLEPKVGSRAVAEEILQSAMLRAVEKGGAIQDEESAVAWFYRVLRNALTDHYRRRASEARALEVQAREPEPPNEVELKDAICGCFRAILPTLKPEYAEIVRRIDLEEEPMAEVASALAITPNNATVRLHRGRQALRKQLEQSCGTCATHGCLDCRCGAGAN